VAKTKSKLQNKAYYHPRNNPLDANNIFFSGVGDDGNT
jgi:hypothetical protein